MICNIKSSLMMLRASKLLSENLLFISQIILITVMVPFFTKKWWLNLPLRICKPKALLKFLAKISSNKFNFKGLLVPQKRIRWKVSLLAPSKWFSEQFKMLWWGFEIQAAKVAKKSGTSNGVITQLLHCNFHFSLQQVQGHGLVGKEGLHRRLPHSLKLHQRAFSVGGKTHLSSLEIGATGCNAQDLKALDPSPRSVTMNGKAILNVICGSA